MTEKEYIPPWRQDILACWTICGMNHYNLNGGRRLFVSMTRFGRCITEEGEDNIYLWKRLVEKAKEETQ